MTRTTVDTKVISRAVELACRAPSLHNSQPWRWVAGETGVDLYVDPGRIVASTDSSGRQAVISCGAVLDHFRVALSAGGWESNVDAFPNPNNLDHLASIDSTPMDYVAEARRDRAAAILRRRTDRRPFGPPEVWGSLEPVLRGAVDRDVIALDVLADDARPRLVEASALNEALRRYDDPYHQELRWWTGGFTWPEGSHDVEVNRRFPAGEHAETAAPEVEDHAKILVLSTFGDTRADALDCGQALSAILLEATIAGLATCPVTHVTELAASRDIVSELITDRGATPQVVVRVGMAPPGAGQPEPTPRRPLSDVFEVRS
ncbi:Acg family FMN-binding oxidoreductase [Mycobacterium parmense]|uniref:Putative NAD(P)H nitroreductase acg n=1 Tax=Mycobacterium parmense TaxID=185642 RepID=A0A7I7YU42_9MYCO|nr:nitroreductase family protein [Mycobacterium parmense]ORW60713.1 NAD(P)H nitroreductase [Mycobacterium parmense]BBZ45388.1 putative NAD(P)H nitroreductase acg [Mycobacterium parmense]